jgi:hypothetical protein
MGRSVAVVLDRENTASEVWPGTRLPVSEGRGTPDEIRWLVHWQEARVG